jgi:hypothetical protein
MIMTCFLIISFSSSRRRFCNRCNCSEQGWRKSGNPKIDPRDASLRSPQGSS